MTAPQEWQLKALADQAALARAALAVLDTDGLTEEKPALYWVGYLQSSLELLAMAAERVTEKDSDGS